MALDGGLRCNDQHLGAMNYAPTEKTYPCQGDEVRRTLGQVSHGRAEQREGEYQ